MSGSEKLYLLHTRPNPQRLAAWAARQKLVTPDQGDFGYALHALLMAAFGENAPRQFHYTDPDQGLLAYTHIGPDEFSQHIALADPDVAAALGLDSTADYAGYRLRLMPTNWPQGFVLGFTLRVRPTVRENATGRERDAFLAAISKNPDTPLERSAVYLDWLRAQLKGRADGDREAWHGAAEIVDAQIESFRLLDVVRRTQTSKEGNERKRRVLTGPDLVLTGRLQVTDPAAFAKLLARGVGRHRAFGLGMLLLRPGG